HGHCTNNRQNISIHRDRNECCISFISIFYYDINASNRRYKNRRIIGRIVVRKSINHNGQCFGQYITDSFSDKEQGTESKPLPFTDIFTGIYIVYLFL
ncbi:hypothetical protein LIZ60_16100, partial [Anaerobutyricum hallii]|nr:hypothetical protein [Anaerobutyricum hallii]